MDGPMRFTPHVSVAAPNISVRNSDHSVSTSASFGGKRENVWSTFFAKLRRTASSANAYQCILFCLFRPILYIRLDEASRNLHRIRWWSADSSAPLFMNTSITLVLKSSIRQTSRSATFGSPNLPICTKCICGCLCGGKTYSLWTSLQRRRSPVVACPVL